MDSLKSSAPAFVNGMHQADEQLVLGDPDFKSPIFASGAARFLDGVFLIAGDDIRSIDKELVNVLSIVNADGKEVIKELGTEVGEERWNEPKHEQ